MANCCITSIVVRGRKECVEEFDKIIHADYDYTNMEFSYIPHFNRVRDVDDGLYQEYGLMAIKDYVIDCAWSAELCLMNTPMSYYSRRAEEEKLNGTPNKSTNIVDVSKKYGLDIELWSQEAGCGFEEHILVKQGEVIENECYDYYEYYIDDYKTYDEFIKDNEGYVDPKILTREMFEDAKEVGDPCIEFEEDFAYTFDVNGFETDNGVEMCRIVNNEN